MSTPAFFLSNPKRCFGFAEKNGEMDVELPPTAEAQRNAPVLTTCAVEKHFSRSERARNARALSGVLFLSFCKPAKRLQNETVRTLFALLRHFHVL